MFSFPAATKHRRGGRGGGGLHLHLLFQKQLPEEHVRCLCKKTGRRLSVLFRLSSYMNAKQKRTLMKSFFESQFRYCPLVWMFYSRGVNNKINHRHEWAIRIIYKDNINTFEELLEKDGRYSIHHKMIQTLAIKLFKIKTNLSNNKMYHILQTRGIRYNLRSHTDFGGYCVNTNRFGFKFIEVFGSKSMGYCAFGN